MHSNAENQKSLSKRNPQSRTLKFLDRISVDLLFDRATIPGALIVCLIALGILLFALVRFGKAGELKNDAPLSAVSLQNATESGVSFSCELQGAEESYLIAIPDGYEPTVVSAIPQNGVTLSDEEVRSVRALVSEGPLVQLGAVQSVRGSRIASVTIRPLEGNTLYSSMEIVIGFVSVQNPESAIQERKSSPMFDQMFEATVINFGDLQAWNAQQKSYRLSSQAQATPNGFSYTNDWLRLMIAETGIHRVNHSSLGIGAINSSAVRLFAADGLPVPASTGIPRQSFDEIPIYMIDGGDGVFGAGDYFYFYGESANRWRVAGDSNATFVRNVFTNENTYWLTVDPSVPGAPARMATLVGAPGTALGTITSYRKSLRLEEEVLLSRDGGGDIDNFYDWYWSSTLGTTKAFAANDALTTPGIDDSTRYLVNAIAGAQVLRVNGVQAQSITNPSSELWSYSSGPLVNGNNEITVSQTPFFSRGPYLNYVEVNYLAQLTLANGQCDFAIPDSSGRYLFTLNGAGTTPVIMNVNDPRNPAVVGGGGQVVSQWTFGADLDPAQPNHFVASLQSALLTPSAVIPATTRKLRGDTTSQIDFLVIGPSNWQSALQRYLNHRSAVSSINPRFVAISDIYNEFGFGTPDPSAIRDFLKYAYENYPEPAPSAVLFVGDGSYDIRNVTQTNPVNIIPPYVRPSRFEHDYISDDSYVYFDDFAFLDSDSNHVSGSNYGVDMTPCRWPVRNLSELNTVIDKVIEYESMPEYGPWRAKVTLLADDEFSSEFITEAIHVQQTQDLELNHLPDFFSRDKIYCWDYPMSSLRQRPTVNDAIVRTINEGTLVFNYVGHGNPSLFAHERVFTVQQDLPRLRNRGRWPLVFTASCSIGFFDDPSTEGMAEQLLRMPDGAIAVVSATRLVYSQANALFNRVAYDHLFSPQNLSMAQAVYAAKMSRQTPSGTADNDRRFSFFGDPYIHLATPKHSIAFTQAPDTLMALQPTTIAGEVRDEFNATLTNFNGEAEVVIRDSKSTREHIVLNQQGDVSADVFYDIEGPIIYRGSTDVINGQFSLTFIPSLDISFGALAAQIRVYASSATSDALGVRDSLPVGATIPNVTDNQGPSIEINVEGRDAFGSGDPLAEGEVLLVRVSDPIGVNLSDFFGHGITLTIDNDIASRQQLSQNFVYDNGSFIAGQSSFAIPELDPGVHSFTITAWDNANNSSTMTFTADIGMGTESGIVDLLNYPNPMTDQTGFYFTLMQPAERMVVQIFTLSGLKVYEKEERGLPRGYNENRFVWNGRDSDGDRLAHGVYLFKATAYTASSNESVEQFGKLVINN